VTELVGKCDHQSAGWLSARHFLYVCTNPVLYSDLNGMSRFDSDMLTSLDFFIRDHTDDEETAFDSEFENDGPRLEILRVF